MERMRLQTLIAKHFSQKPVDLSKMAEVNTSIPLLCLSVCLSACPCLGYFSPIRIFSEWLILSCPVLPCPVLSYPILSNLILSYSTLSYPIPPCSDVMLCFVLFCSIFHFSTFISIFIYTSDFSFVSSFIAFLPPYPLALSLLLLHLLSCLCPLLFTTTTSSLHSCSSLRYPLFLHLSLSSSLLYCFLSSIFFFPSFQVSR